MDRLTKGASNQPVVSAGMSMHTQVCVDRRHYNCGEHDRKWTIGIIICLSYQLAYVSDWAGASGQIFELSPRTEHTYEWHCCSVACVPLPFVHKLPFSCRCDGESKVCKLPATKCVSKHTDTDSADRQTNGVT